MSVMSTSTDLAALIERSIRTGGFAGAAVAVVRGGATVFEHYAGEAAAGLPSSPAVLWPIASITKCFTAAMIMRLVELGELTVNMRVSSILPLPAGGRPVGEPSGGRAVQHPHPHRP